jgi:hypothetical protein
MDNEQKPSLDDEIVTALARQLRLARAERDRLREQLGAENRRRKDENRDALLGPTYVEPWLDSDGRVIARRAGDHRKSWIRTFAASALPEALRDAHAHDRSDPVSVAANYSHAVALQMWKTLEAGFAAEAAAEAAQVKVKKGEDDGEGDEP